MKEMVLNSRKPRIKRSLSFTHYPSVHVYAGHHSTIGGSENYTYQVINALAPCRLSIDWGVTPVDPGLFGVRLPDRPTVMVEPDVFSNLSERELRLRMGKYNIAVIFGLVRPEWKDRIRDFEVVTVSEFSRGEIKRIWGVDSTVIYPCIDLSRFYALPKRPQIMSVGSFSGQHGKKQLEMIEVFKYFFKGWKLLLVGAVDDGLYLDRCMDMAVGENIEFTAGASFDELSKLYAESAMYWNFTGLEETEASAFESFGTATLEAVASRRRTFVPDSGGSVEIPGVHLWSDIQLMVNVAIAGNPTIDQVPEHDQLSEFSQATFARRWLDLVGVIGALSSIRGMS